MIHTEIPFPFVVPHASEATGALGGTPSGATTRVRGVAAWARWRHTIAATGGTPWSSPWGHEACGVCGSGRRGAMRAQPLGPPVGPRSV
eukprot:9479220-Pyramimonas_sp.AAC.1